MTTCSPEGRISFTDKGPLSTLSFYFGTLARLVLPGATNIPIREISPPPHSLLTVLRVGRNIDIIIHFLRTILSSQTGLLLHLLHRPQRAISSTTCAISRLPDPYHISLIPYHIQSPNMSPSYKAWANGPAVPLTTPFKADESVDYEALTKQVVRLAKAKVGIVLLGTNGEGEFNHPYSSPCSYPDSG